MNIEEIIIYIFTGLIVSIEDVDIMTRVRNALIGIAIGMMFDLYPILSKILAIAMLLIIGSITTASLLALEG